MPTITKSLGVRFLVLLNVLNAVFLVRRLVARVTSAEEHDVYRGREFPYTFLRSPLDPVLLSLDHSSTQYPILGNRSDMEWLFLTSKNVGWARIGLNHRLVQPSFFHEIHCLRMLNLALHRDPSASAHHSRHCLHYARSMALCHADVTLEPVVHINDSVAMWDTTQATHVCKDWSALYRGMDENWEQWKTRA